MKLGDDEDDSESDDDSDSGDASQKAGYIRRLTLKNFMCHDHFELKFGPQMNFIIGRNGSGKSAVLTGISVGLGAKATDTSRGSSIKSLIKDGKSTARIVVEIDNDGYGSYEKETYGKVIIVERKLTREGTNAYAIKSETGAVVSNKKKTLDDILQKFFIVVNNPLSFLSQDKAREFIASSTEQSRFTYFSEGTNIQSILQNYQEASRNILSLQKRSMAAKDYYTEACQRYAECERAYKKYKHSHTLRQQQQKINGKIYWFNVQIVERRIKKKVNEIESKQEELLEIDRKRAANEQSISSNDEQAASLDSQRQDLKEKLEARNLQTSRVEVAFSDANRQVQTYRADLVNYKNEIEDLSRQVAKHHEDIELEQKKIDEANGGSKEKMGQRLEALKKRQQVLTDERQELQAQARSLDQTSPRVEAVRREIEEHRMVKQNLLEKQRNLARNKDDKYAAFGYNINYLVRNIEKENKWHEKPIGPLGCHVSMKEEFSQWGDTINAMLLKTLDSFVVCDEHDRRLLNEHMKRLKIHKTIIVRKFEKFDYHTNVPKGFRTFLDIVNIDDDNVKYSLIDSSSLERSVICDSIRDAEEVSKSYDVRMALALNDRQSSTRVTRPGGQLSRDPIFYSRDLRKLAGKVDGNEIETELKEAYAEERRLELKRLQLLAEEFEAKKSIQRMLEEKKTFLKEINNQIFNLERTLQDEGDYGRIESMKSQIESCENQIKTREGMSVELLQNLNKSKSELAKIKEELQESQLLKAEIVNELTSLEDTITKFEETSQVLAAENEGLEKRKGEIDFEIEARKEKKRSDEEKLQELEGIALENCQRDEVEILPTDTTELITKEFREINNAIEEAEKSNLKTFEEIQEEVLHSKALKDQCETSLEELDNARITLENDLNSRFENLNITIKEKLTRAKLSFEQSLALRGFKGKLEFDFANKKVITEVQTKDDKEHRAVLSLSGGEKSFTQIAFLLSIWKVMKPRVCGLDEFDVFMDSVNRTIAIRLLIHELRNTSAQSIFITPQDIAVVGDLKDSEDVRIHRIRAPRND